MHTEENEGFTTKEKNTIEGEVEVGAPGPETAVCVDP
jgi:hypothetical protein